MTWHLPKNKSPSLMENENPTSSHPWPFGRSGSLGSYTTRNFDVDMETRQSGHRVNNFKVRYFVTTSTDTGASTSEWSTVNATIQP